MTEEAALPPAVLLVRDFVNTYEPQTGEEAWTTPALLHHWLTQRQLTPPDARLDASDLAAAITIREGLRNVLLGHAGHACDPAAIEDLDRALAQVPVRLTFTDGAAHLAPAHTSALDHALAPLVEAIRQSSEDHTWTKLKVCARHTCHWAFYDASRNQARRWCSMAGCGNHIKMRRAYATRRARTAPGPTTSTTTPQPPR